MKYLTQEDCEVDLLRRIFNNSNRISQNILVGGHSQSGKTTWIWFVSNRICQLRKYGYKALNPFAPCNTYREWDWKKFSATDPQKFVDIWNNYPGSVMTLSEASTQLYFLDWFKIMGRVFNSSSTVLGKQRQICFIDTVFEGDLMKSIKSKIDYRIEIHERDERNNQAVVRSGWSLIDYLRMKWMLIPDNESHWKYTKKILLLAKQYTDWVSATLKKDEMEENERRVGLRPSIYEDELAEEAAETKKWVEENQKEPASVTLY